MEEKIIPKKNWFVPVSIIIGALMIGGSWIYTAGMRELNKAPLVSSGLSTTQGFNENGSLERVRLPITWGDLGVQMVRSGVIDTAKFESVYIDRGGLSAEERGLLSSNSNSEVYMNEENAGFLLNMLWALGLSNKNDILEKGPMMNPQYGGAGGFASTAGWTLARGDAMGHYSQHRFFRLSSEEQALVERISQNIYRPCCGNSTYFPDCNHGMAMLGLLELMASQGVREDEMYRVALMANRFWFPDQYAVIEEYLKNNARDIETIDPRVVLSVSYSSNTGFQNVVREVSSPTQKKSGSCGV